METLAGPWPLKQVAGPWPLKQVAGPWPLKHLHNPSSASTTSHDWLIAIIGSAPVLTPNVVAHAAGDSLSQG
jgi:hypothetical protein